MQDILLRLSFFPGTFLVQFMGLKPRFPVKLFATISKPFFFKFLPGLHLHTAFHTSLDIQPGMQNVV